MRKVAVVCLFLGGLSAWGAPDSGPLAILQDEYPRAFYFRQAEGMAANQRLDYDTWEKRFLLLDGIIGKCLDEEVPGRMRRNPEFFTRFKQRHPEKLVLLHYNGNSRDPRFQTEPYFAGHWLYYNGCGLRADVTPDAETLPVEDPALFMVNIGLYHDRNDDIGICRLGADGRPDWSVSEQVELLGVDTATRTITVRRGALGTTARTWKAGETYAAAHVTEGPWGQRSNLLWGHNYATTCPRSPDGKQLADHLVDDLGRWFDADGPLAAFDGLEFDVLFRKPLGGSNMRGVDVDADGQRDDGVVGDAPVYEQGLLQFLAALRQRLGEERLILADGHEDYNQRAVPFLNGIESEGWPHLHDPVVGDWSGGLNRHGYWQAHGHAPAFSYINHKYVEKLDTIDVPLNITRLVLAGAIFTDSAFTCSIHPPSDRQHPFAVWDELVQGDAQQPRWLGKPLGSTRALALDSPDLLAGLEAPVWTVEDGKMSATIPGLRVPGPDLTVACTLRGESLDDFPQGVPRLAEVHCRLAGQLIQANLPQATVQRRGKKPEPLTTPSTLLSYAPAQALGSERHEAYFAHPPYGPGGTGALVWSRTVLVPREAPVLRFHTGLRQAPSPTDGVTFRIEAVSKSGSVQEVFSTHQREFAWHHHEADLAPWAGQRITLRFLTDCGPADNPGADHAFWGDIYVTPKGQAAQRPGDTPGTLMTWVGKAPFASRFFFRGIGPATVDLVLEVEGNAPVQLEALSAHSAADAVVRAFEHGVVLANPANHEYTFDLAALFPDRRFRRIHGAQDPVANSGKPVGNTLTLPPRDALFLVDKGETAQ